MSIDLINKSTCVVSDIYLIIKPIGSGSFGDVYLAEHKDGGYVAAKIEDRKKSPRIINEYKIYEYLHKNKFNVGLPKIYDFIQTPDYNMIFMQLLGPSLEDIFVKYKRKLQLASVLLLGIQLTQLLEQLHGTNFIHRDIKPSNFLIGRDVNCNQTYMMDFGLSKKYKSNGKHIEFRDNRSLIGTARYASRNMHMGFEPSRRDDLESVGYMLVYFIKGALPWQGLKRQKGVNHLEVIGESKICTSIESLCEGIPDCFKEFLIYCRKLKFEEDPDYSYLKNLFKNYGVRANITPSFEWVTKN